jgi:DNA-binding NarL/FixJ family response regulator
MAAAVLRRAVGPKAFADGSPLASLSDRELEVFTLVGQGYGPAEIAERLHLSVKTVETYRTHLREKLHLEDAAGLRRFAIRWLQEGQQR